MDIADGGGRTALLVAIGTEQPQVALFLLERGASPSGCDEKGRSALQLSLFHDYGSVSETMLRAGADPNTQVDGIPGLYLALSKSQEKLAVEFVKCGATVNFSIKGSHPLWVAIHNQMPLAAKTLLAHGADVNSSNTTGHYGLAVRGWSPLHLAVATGQHELENLLIEAGADSNLKTGDGFSVANLRIDGAIMTVASLLDDRGKWREEKKAQQLYWTLRQADEGKLNRAFERTIVAGHKMRQIIIIAIKLGRRGTEAALGEVLTQSGDAQMAYEYLNSGSNTLANYARFWAAAHGYSITQGAGTRGVTWGEF